jgi:polynucleotide 5'-kinase involved in rRNA processing
MADKENAEKQFDDLIKALIEKVHNASNRLRGEIDRKWYVPNKAKIAANKFDEIEHRIRSLMDGTGRREDILLLGPSGSGKTSFTSCMVKLSWLR